MKEPYEASLYILNKNISQQRNAAFTRHELLMKISVPSTDKLPVSYHPDMFPSHSKQYRDKEKVQIITDEKYGLFL